MDDKPISETPAQVEVPRHLFSILQQTVTATNVAMQAANAAQEKARALASVADALVAAVIKDAGQTLAAFGNYELVDEGARTFVRAKAQPAQ